MWLVFIGSTPALASPDVEPVRTGLVLARASIVGSSPRAIGEPTEQFADFPKIDSLVLEEIDDELVELCGVDTDNDPRHVWLDKIKERLRTDLDRFREDLVTDRDQIEQWELEGARIYTSVGEWEDESNPNSGHGWMCRLVDSGALGAARFKSIRRTEL